MRYPTRNPNEYRDLVIEVVAVLTVVMLWGFIMTASAL
jgi:hypothetical protein